MLIRFTVENFLSFKDEVEFSMISGQGTALKNHIIKDKKTNGINLLRSGVLYGANASGKSNFVKALSTAQHIILKTSNRGELFEENSFKLNKINRSRPVKFEFEIRVGENNYAYGFSYTSKKIEEEWLYIISKSGEKRVFERKGDKTEIDPSIVKLKKERDRLHYMADDLLENQLFLSSANNRNIDNIKGAKSFIEVYGWFHSTLTIIHPDSRYMGGHIFLEEDGFARKFKKLISYFDTGIKDIVYKKISTEQISKRIPDEILEDLKRDRDIDQQNIVIGSDSKYNRFMIKRNANNELEFEELFNIHEGSDDDVSFEMSEESDGTKRLTDFIPLLIQASMENKVFVVDEICRSFHTELTAYFMQLFLRISMVHDSQIIATTHDVKLLDLNLLRKDEIWFADKNKKGVSTIYSLDEYKPRQDLDIKKGYLHGRFGATPFLNKKVEDIVGDLTVNG